MGSIKTGKDADLVLWTDNPLSVYSKVRQTYIDGIPYFDSERDLALREEMKTERAKLIAKMIKAKKEGEETRKPEKKEQKLYHCDTLEQE
jgi:adenine deaminase